MARAIRAALAVFDRLAALGLALLLGVVAAAVLGRLAYDLTGGAVNLLLSGAIEMSRHALMLTVLAALPRALASGLLRVDLLIGALPRGLAGPLERLWHLAAAGIGALAAWRLAETAALQASRGDLTSDLAVPLWPTTAFAALALAFFAVVGVWRAAAPAPVP